MSLSRGSRRMLLVAAVLVGCAPAAEEPQAEPAAPIRVQVSRVHRGEIAAVVNAVGQTEALSMLRLASPVAGRVTMLSVRPGDALAQGAVAARIIPLENEAAVHGFALLERAGALSAAERESGRKLRNDLGARDVPLRAPFPAVVAERLHNPGEQVAPNDVLLELFDPHSLYVIAQVPAAAAAQLRAGQAVDVRAGQAPVAGVVETVITVMTPEALTLPVRIALTSLLQPPLLHAAVECRITVTRHTDALVIPRSALLSSTASQSGTVMVAVNGRAERREIQLGLRTSDELEVLAGLAPTDMVLTQGQYALPQGTRIEAVTAEAASPAAPSQPQTE